MTPRGVRSTGNGGDPARATGSFSVTIPAHTDEEELYATVSRLYASRRPPFEVRLIARADDPGARASATWVAAHHPGRVKVVVDGPLFDVMSDGVRSARRRPADLFSRARELALRVPRNVLLGLLAFAIVEAAVAASLLYAPLLYLLYVGVSLIFGVIAWTTLAWMVTAWRTPASLTESRLADEAVEPAHSFSLIVPARHEEAVLETTLSRLVTSTHPAFEVLVVVGTDDQRTRAVAERLAARHPELVKVVLDESWPKNKPKALNAALPNCRGTVTGVFDAEDDVHPALLRRVDQCFQRSDADVVQAGVQLMNFRSSWLTVRNVLEYYFWFRSRLHFQARQGFIPLGGNTVFVRTQLLRAVSGWDPDCLAEDCELGVRLSALGARTAVFYEPELVTREECPPTLGAFARQRTRWNQGFLQTFAKGYWRGLPLRRRALGAYTLTMPYLMAFAWVMIPVAIVTALAVKAPVPVTLLSFMPALPLVSTLAVEVAGLNDFCRTYGERATARDYGRLVLGLPVYQGVLGFAAARALVREARGDRGWEKTAHSGLHLAQPTAEGFERWGAPLRAPARQARVGGAEGGVAVLEREARAVAAPPKALGGTNGAPRWNGCGGGHDLVVAAGAEPLRLRSGAGAANGSTPHSPPIVAGLARGRPRAGLAVASHTDVALLLALLAGVGVVLGTNTFHWPDIQFDEGTYIYNAWAVPHGALAPYTYSYGHPPLSWLLIALWTSVLGIFGHGDFSIDTGRELMFVLTLVSSALVYALARRLGMGRAFAAAALVLFALCPVGLFYHRAVLLDNVAVAWLLAAFVLALTPRRRLWAFAGSGACFALSILSKETTLVLLPALLVAAAQNADRRTRRYCLTLFGSFLCLIVLAFPLYAALKGELVPGTGHVSLVGSSVNQLFTRQATGSLFDPQSQTHAIVTSWLQLDAWLLGAALVLTPVALALRSTRAVALAFAIGVVMILRPGYLPNMYVLALLPFAALIVAGTGDVLWTRWWTNGGGPLATVAGAVPLALAFALLAVVVFPRWADRADVAMTARPDAPQRAAERWLLAHVGHDKRLIVSDEFWIHLVEHGFDHRRLPGGFFSGTVVAYWPLDYDPAVKSRFPNGWRDFDYVVSTEPVRATLNRTPTTARALDHSRVVARFGRGAGRIEVRAIDRSTGPSG